MLETYSVPVDVPLLLEVLFVSVARIDRLEWHLKSLDQLFTSKQRNKNVTKHWVEVLTLLPLLWVFVFWFPIVDDNYDDDAWKTNGRFFLSQTEMFLRLWNDFQVLLFFINSVVLSGWSSNGWLILIIFI
jgi:hypothetical protein